MRTLEEASGPEACTPAVAGAAGTHIVLPGYYCPTGMGLLDINTSDGRFLFFLPWLGSTVVGTTDVKGTPTSTPTAPEDEIQWILNEVQKYLNPELRVRRSDVLSAWRGWRPLASDPHLPPGAPVSRDHIISSHPVTGTTFITGGKWTTYREMAQEVVDHAIALKGFDHRDAAAALRPCATLSKKLWGGEGYTANTAIRLVQKYGISEEQAKHFATTYGAHAFAVCASARPTGLAWPRFGAPLVEGYPYDECEVAWAVRREYARTVTDILTLRTRLAYLNSRAAMQAAPRVASLMAAELGWSAEQEATELASCLKVLREFGGPVAQVEEGRLTEVVPQLPTDLQELFALLDADGNEYIDLEEMQHGAQLLGFPFESDARALEVFQEMDRTGDGRVTELEFTQWWMLAGQEENDCSVGGKLRQRLAARFGFSHKAVRSARGVAFG